ncbi:hypothetical protein AB432_027820 [Brevibacillus brevis]|uniref:Uncharacterized protein n=1 Tax=Brevibacillus brevis TaxID=1393 RepID=A0A2Z4MPY5_BREBE|nr:hypothetical protein AB432_027820 [Brevibacillus brevis]
MMEIKTENDRAELKKFWKSDLYRMSQLFYNGERKSLRRKVFLAKMGVYEVSMNSMSSMVGWRVLHKKLLKTSQVS